MRLGETAGVSVVFVDVLKSLFGEATFYQRYLMLESDSNPDSQQIGGSKHEDLQLCKRL